MYKYVLLILFVLFLFAGFLFLNSKPFGRLPGLTRTKVILNSPNYKDGKFHNLEITPDLAEGETTFSVLWYFLFKRPKDFQPNKKIPTIKTDLKSIPAAEDVIVWLGHASYFMQIDGKRFLIDPLIGNYLDPLPYFGKAFEGTDIYSADDFPEIDYVLLTHDHYDHLDLQTLSKLQNKIKLIITGLGVGENLEFWGFDTSKIIEKDWNQSVNLSDNFKLTFLTARHFSGRAFKRNQTLWGSYALKTPNYNLYLGGDSGYGKHFAEIGREHGPFDLAILDCGQYDLKWRYIHMQPKEVLIANQDLKSSALLPGHNSKFTIANHSWYEPLAKVSMYNEKYKTRLLTPLIGEKVILSDKNQKFKKWWEEVIEP